MPDPTGPVQDWEQVFQLISHAIQSKMKSVDTAAGQHHIDPPFTGNPLYGGTTPSKGPTPGLTMGPQPTADFGPQGMPKPQPTGRRMSINDILNQMQMVQPAHDAAAALSAAPAIMHAFVMALKNPEDLAKLMNVVGRQLQPAVRHQTTEGAEYSPVRSGTFMVSATHPDATEKLANQFKNSSDLLQIKNPETSDIVEHASYGLGGPTLQHYAWDPADRVLNLRPPKGEAPPEYLGGRVLQHFLGPSGANEAYDKIAHRTDIEGIFKLLTGKAAPPEIQRGASTSAMVDRLAAELLRQEGFSAAAYRSPEFKPSFWKIKEAITKKMGADTVLKDLHARVQALNKKMFDMRANDTAYLGPSSLTPEYEALVEESKDLSNSISKITGDAEARTRRVMQHPLVGHTEIFHVEPLASEKPYTANATRDIMDILKGKFKGGQPGPPYMSPEDFKKWQTGTFKDAVSE